MLADSELLVMIWVENCWSRFWCYSIKLSEFKQWLVLYRTFWIQVLLKFLIFDDEFNKELIKSNTFMFFSFDSIKISILNQDSSLEISGFYQTFWTQVLILLLKFLSSTSDWVDCVACFCIVYTSIARLMSFELMLWVCIERIIWVYSN